jgi:hypothetical protein
VELEITQSAYTWTQRRKEERNCKGKERKRMNERKEGC